MNHTFIIPILFFLYSFIIATFLLKYKYFILVVCNFKQKEQYAICNLLELIFSDFLLLRFIYFYVTFVYSFRLLCNCSLCVHPNALFFHSPPVSIWIEIELPDLASKNIGHPVQFKFQINIVFLNISLSHKIFKNDYTTKSFIVWNSNWTRHPVFYLATLPWEWSCCEHSYMCLLLDMPGFLLGLYLCVLLFDLRRKNKLLS